VPLCGWVANSCSEDMPYLKENIAYLTNAIHAPLLDVINYNASFNATKLLSLFRREYSSV